MPFSIVTKAAFLNFKNLLFLEIVCFVSKRFAGFFGHNHATFRNSFQNISGKKFYIELSTCHWAGGIYEFCN